MALCSQVVKFMMAWLPFMTMVRMVLKLKNNIKQYWWQSMVLLHENIVGRCSYLHAPYSMEAV